MVFTAERRRKFFGDDDYLFGDWSKLSTAEKNKRRAVGLGVGLAGGALGHFGAHALGRESNLDKLARYLGRETKFSKKLKARNRNQPSRQTRRKRRSRKSKSRRRSRRRSRH